MEIMVLPDGETYGAVDRCTIRRVPDGASAEQTDELVAQGGGEVLVSLEDHRRRPPRSPQAERRPLVFRRDQAAYHPAASVRPLREALEHYATTPTCPRTSASAPGTRSRVSGR